MCYSAYPLFPCISARNGKENSHCHILHWLWAKNLKEAGRSAFFVKKKNPNLFFLHFYANCVIHSSPTKMYAYFVTRKRRVKNKPRMKWQLCWKYVPIHQRSECAFKFSHPKSFWIWSVIHCSNVQKVFLFKKNCNPLPTTLQFFSIHLKLHEFYGSWMMATPHLYLFA